MIELFKLDEEREREHQLKMKAMDEAYKNELRKQELLMEKKKQFRKTTRRAIRTC